MSEVLPQIFHLLPLWDKWRHNITHKYPNLSKNPATITCNGILYRPPLWLEITLNTVILKQMWTIICRRFLPFLQGTHVISAWSHTEYALNCLLFKANGWNTLFTSLCEVCYQPTRWSCNMVPEVAVRWHCTELFAAFCLRTLHTQSAIYGNVPSSRSLLSLPVCSFCNTQYL